MSSPPETITTVWAIARMPRMVIARPILTRLRGRKNTSGRSEPKIATRMTSARSRLRFWVPTRATTSAARALAAPVARPRLGVDHAAAFSRCGLAHGEGRTASSVAAAVGSSPTIGACAHDDDPVGEAEQLGQLGGDHQDGDAGRGQLVDQPVDLELGADVDAAGRLVQDQDARLARQPAGEHHLLLVAAGELAHLLLDRWAS